MRFGFFFSFLLVLLLSTRIDGDVIDVIDVVVVIVVGIRGGHGAVG